MVCFRRFRPHVSELRPLLLIISLRLFLPRVCQHSIITSADTSTTAATHRMTQDFSYYVSCAAAFDNTLTTAAAQTYT